MDGSFAGEVPAILQLCKWVPSKFQLKLSEFREAFISPTREQLLLLSYQCEALLLPLTKDDPVDNMVPEICYVESSEHLRSSASFSQVLTTPSRSDSMDSIPCPSGSVIDFSNGFSLDSKVSKANSYPFISDVNSLAWGVCGDTYNQHEDVSFRELLFVSGNHGVTVHAFSSLDETSEKMTTPMPEVEFRQGSWVEWGPSTSARTVEGEDYINLCPDAFGNVMDEKNANRNRGGLHKTCKNTDYGTSSRFNASKRWLRSFFTKADTAQSEGYIWTRFPDKTSFPGFAKVVSFSILDSNNLLLSDFLSRGSSVVNKELSEEKDLENNLRMKSNLISCAKTFDADVLSRDVDACVNNLFRCTRVFSSNSHRLVGFFFKLVNPSSVGKSDNTEASSSSNVIIVSQLHSQGMQWVSVMKLKESFVDREATEWTDFQFSDSLLVCLNIAGEIFFYGATSGEYISHVNILQTYGLNPSMSMRGREKSTLGADKQNKQVSEVSCESTCYLANCCVRRMFRRLIVSLDSSFLASIDEYGVIYVINAGDHVPNEHYAYERLLPNFQYSGLGMLVGWNVAGLHIGNQRMHPNLAKHHDLNSLSKGSGEIFISGNVGGNMVHTLGKSYLHGRGDWGDKRLNGFSAQSRLNSQRFNVSETQSYPIRRIFLPSDRFGGDDCICFSPFGITRLNRNCNSKDERSAQIIHLNLPIDMSVTKNSMCDITHVQGRKEVSIGEAVGCSFQGYIYLVTKCGLSVFLPSVSVPSDFLPLEISGHQQPSRNTGIGSQLEMSQLNQPYLCSCSPWQVEILDRVLLFEGPEKADCVCLENGWDLKISRMRRLQMALDYLKFNEINESLDMLVNVELAEEGILRLLFSAIHLLVQKRSSDNEVSVASRLLALATCFATKMIRKYGFVEHKREAYLLERLHGSRMLCLPSILPDKAENEIGNSRRMHEMARFLEIIRNLQRRISAKFKKSSQGDGERALSLVDPGSLQDESHFSIAPADALSLETLNKQEITISASASAFNDTDKFALMPKDYVNTKASGVSDDSTDVADLEPKKVLPLENPKEMVARWKIDKLDLKSVVKDALLSGRLPLAVLQLHLHRSREIIADEEPHDTFTEVRVIGRAIAYDLFLKGEIGLAVTTLEKLGEDIETCLKELFFGTVRRSLRVQITEEMRRYGYLGPNDCKILERLSLIERFYPSSVFWKTFEGRQKLKQVASTLNSIEEINLHLLGSHMFNNLIIKCGEIDGVVLGSWTSTNENSSDPMIEEDNSQAGYWAAAAVWYGAWDQRTIDRIVLDQPLLMGVHVPWESQMEYYISHNDWDEVSKLLDLVPASVLSDGILQIALDGLQPALTVECNSEFSDCGNYICSIEELDVVCMDVPDVKIFRLSSDVMCSTWLRMLMEQELAKKFIFLKEYWEGTAEIVNLLARAGFITQEYNVPLEEDLIKGSSGLNFLESDERFHVNTIHALHKLVVQHCAQYNLPNLLDLYLDHHKLVLDNDSLCSLEDSAGDCQWAKWLLLSRIKGREYDASFSNARSIMSHSLVLGRNITLPEIDEIICTVDDIAEGGGEMGALATLMYAPAPIQRCISSGSINRHSSSSAQCTLENLRPTLQRFPTLWRKLLAACFGQDTTSNFLGPRVRNAFTDHLNWRDNIFFSAVRDTSLLQMLPCWFPKAVRRLVQLYIQGPLGWQSFSGLPVGESVLHRNIDFSINSDEHAEMNAISWEAIIQRHIEDELYDSSREETGLGLEHHLHRGRALAAFNRLLGLRIEKLKLEDSLMHGQSNVQSDVQILLSPITQSEESLVSFVMPVAITHFEDSVFVASCAFLLELCGLSASMLRVDIAVLRRISSFYQCTQNGDISKQVLGKGSAFHSLHHEGDIVAYLAQALADEYVHQDTVGSFNQKGAPKIIANRRPCRALMLVLLHLEKASLPQLVGGRTCGTWLLSGNGDGAELRNGQKAASQLWSLVTNFCQMHQLPVSTKYLALLARDNDWVGFLSEAQIGGYPFDIVMQVASKEFSDRRLRIHILTVLKGMQSKKKASFSVHAENMERRTGNSFSDDNEYIPIELFRILADCEKQKNPGEALLINAKDLSWSTLAIIASCFPDVSPMSCLTVWLEITAARETSSIKVNDIASQIAENVASAVEASNSLPADCRAVQFRYNRQTPKRRRLMEPVDSLPPLSDSASTSRGGVFTAQSIISTEQRKTEFSEHNSVASDLGDGPASLSKMVAVLCEQHLFLPLLRSFEMFLPSCALLPFIRALQAFTQMRLSEASAHLGSFSARIRDEPTHLHVHVGRESHVGTSWISSIAIKAADAMLSTCPSPYEKRCLLQLLAATDFGDGGSAATYYRRVYWKINLAEPLLRKDDDLHLGNETLDDDASLLTALIKSRQWEQARNWARQLETSGSPWKSIVHHVTETQAESMVAEWKEFLWDVPEERIALWGHCQTLFIRYSFPALQAGLFFLKHADTGEKDLPARELHELLLLSLQWLSGMITQSNPVYPLHLLREIETRVWLLAVESEAQLKSEGDFTSNCFSKDTGNGNSINIIDRAANIITKMDNHITTVRSKTLEKHDGRDISQVHHRNQIFDTSSSTIAGGSTKTKRRAKGYVPPRRAVMDFMEKSIDSEDSLSSLNFKNDLQFHDESVKLEISFSKWEEKIDPAELERAVLSLLEFGQVTAAKQLQHKLSPGPVTPELLLADAALKLAAMSTPSRKLLLSMLDEEVRSVFKSYKIQTVEHLVNPLQVLESFATIMTEGGGRGLCKRIIAVVKAANVLGLSFSEAFDKQPVELLQLLSLKAQESFEEACLLVQTHSMPAASIAQILAESFLKGLLAAHRGGYMDSQKEEGPAPLLWRFSDFLKWAELCPSESEIGHALMRLVITGQEIPHACEVELLILSHHFYRSSACLDGVDVLVALAATRVEAYVAEGDFPCLARLITGVDNFHALNFILGILIENGQLDLLLRKYSAAADTNTSTAEAVRGFRMSVLTSLKHFNPNDLDAFAMVYNHFDMKHETASLLESRAVLASQHWFRRYDRDQNEDLLDSMRYYIEAAEVHSSIDAGNKTCRACAQASLVSLQIRMPDSRWLSLSETNARRALVEQSRFQEALIVAEAYGLNQASEWALVLWNQMLNPELTEEFVAEFVAVLPLQPSMLIELARFYRAEVAARGDQSQFSVWLTGGGLPAEWAKYLGRSFRYLLKRTRDLRLRLQLATVATGFGDVVDVCMKALDKVPDAAGPLILRKGHGGAYLPLM